MVNPFPKLYRLNRTPENSAILNELGACIASLNGPAAEPKEIRRRKRYGIYEYIGGGEQHGTHEAEA